MGVGVPGERLGPAARQERVQDPRPQPERVARATGKGCHFYVLLIKLM